MDKSSSLQSSDSDTAEKIKSAKAFKQDEAQSLMQSIHPIHTGLQPPRLSCETIRVV